jgi:predicted nucleotidyltransferase
MSTDLLEIAANALGPPLDDVVFLGGASIHLWLSDPAAPATRATDDVDVISDVTSLIDYYRLGQRLHERGFSEAGDSSVICRWQHRETGLTLDVMPCDENVLGFSNPWYAHTIRTAIDRRLPSGTKIRAAAPSSIIATKLAAWKGRGKNDTLRSLDLHDILVLIDGRPELPNEIAVHAELQRHIAQELADLRKDPYFTHLTESALHGYGQLATPRAHQLQQQIDTIIAGAGLSA